MLDIDWARLAEPQEDGYDTAVLLELLKTGHYAERQQPAPPAGDPVWVDGRARWMVELPPEKRPSPDYELLPPDDSFVRGGLQLLDLWPAARRQSADILIGLCPLTMLAYASRRGGGHGGSCGHFGDDFGWIYCTADDTWGFAEGIVHEMGHWKLRALGMWFEDWTPLILDHKPDELFVSPVRKDKARPMGAVLHAQYSYIHVARISTLTLRATQEPQKQDVDWAELQLNRITEGQGTLREHARGTSGVGELFLRGVDEWTTRVLEEGRAIVADARTRVS